MTHRPLYRQARRASLCSFLGASFVACLFSVEAAAQIRESLSGMKSGLGCGDLHQRANARAQAILEAQRRSERAYDQATGHGRTQGVTL